MQEDILGTRRAAMPTLVFVTCVRCGKATLRGEAKIVDASAYADSEAEFEYLCRDCQIAVANGEDIISEDA